MVQGKCILTTKPPVLATSTTYFIASVKSCMGSPRTFILSLETMHAKVHHIGKDSQINWLPCPLWLYTVTVDI